MNFECALCDFETPLENEIMTHCNLHDLLELTPGHIQTPPHSTPRAKLNQSKPRHRSKITTDHSPQALQTLSQSFKYKQNLHNSPQHEPTPAIFPTPNTITTNDRKLELKRLRITKDLELDDFIIELESIVDAIPPQFLFEKPYHPYDPHCSLILPTSPKHPPTSAKTKT